MSRRSLEREARSLVEAWLRGITQGGHIVTPEEIAEVYHTALVRLRGS